MDTTGNTSLVSYGMNFIPWYQYPGIIWSNDKLVIPVYWVRLLILGGICKVRAAQRVRPGPGQLWVRVSKRVKDQKMDGVPCSNSIV